MIIRRRHRAFADRHSRKDFEKMKLILDKPIVVGQGPTLEEADWGPWQFPQLLKREDKRISESKKRRRLYGKGQRRRRC